VVIRQVVSAFRVEENLTTQHHLQSVRASSIYWNGALQADAQMLFSTLFECPKQCTPKIIILAMKLDQRKEKAQETEKIIIRALPHRFLLPQP